MKNTWTISLLTLLAVCCFCTVAHAAVNPDMTVAATVTTTGNATVSKNEDLNVKATLDWHGLQSYEGYFTWSAPSGKFALITDPASTFTNPAGEPVADAHESEAVYKTDVAGNVTLSCSWTLDEMQYPDINEGSASGSMDVTVLGDLDSVSTNAKDYSKWTEQPVSVTATATLENNSSLGSRSIIFTLKDVESNTVCDTQTVSSTTYTFQVSGPGRYKVLAKLNNKEVESSKFVFWTFSTNLSSIDYVWDSYINSVAPIFSSVTIYADMTSESVKLAEELSKKLSEGAETAAQTYSNAKNSLLDIRNIMEAHRLALQNQGLLNEAAQVANKIAEIDAIVVDLTASAASGTLRQLASLLANRVGPLLGVWGIVNDFSGIFELAETQEKLDAELAKARSAVDKYDAGLRKAIETNAQRHASPYIKKFTVTTVPGEIKFSLLEIPTWVTHDDKIPNSEKAWNYSHMTLVSGRVDLWFNEGNFKFETSEGETGSKEISLYAYGNLGQSAIYAMCQDESVGKIIDAKSTGSTQEALLSSLEAQLYVNKSKMDDWKMACAAASAFVGFTSAVLAVVGIAAAIPGVNVIVGILGVIGLGILLVGNILIYIWQAIFSPDPLSESIKTLYPRMKG